MKRPMRRSLSLLLLALCAASCKSADPAQPLRVSMIPTTDPGKATREMQPLVDHLARRTGGEVQMTIPTNYAAVVEALRQRLMNQVAHEAAAAGQRPAPREAAVRLVED